MAVNTATERTEIRNSTAAMLREMVAISDRHAAEVPDCPANPLCINGVQAAQVDLLTRNSPIDAFWLIVVAVLEMSQARKREVDLRGRLSIQRTATNDAARALVATNNRVAELEKEIAKLKIEEQYLLARLDEQHSDVIKP